MNDRKQWNTSEMSLIWERIHSIPFSVLHNKSTLACFPQLSSALCHFNMKIAMFLKPDRKSSQDLDLIGPERQRMQISLHFLWLWDRWMRSGLNCTSHRMDYKAAGSLPALRRLIPVTTARQWARTMRQSLKLIHYEKSHLPNSCSVHPESGNVPPYTAA